MFKTFNAADSLCQMNLFVALQVYRNLSSLSYMAATHSALSEAEEDPNDAVDHERTAPKYRTVG